MKDELLRYSCEIRRDTILLIIRGYYVGRYPLSYTFEECIEEFCDLAGWDFNIATQVQSSLSGRVPGMISFQRPDYPNIVTQVRRHRLNYP